MVNWVMVAPYSPSIGTWLAPLSNATSTCSDLGFRV